VQTSVVTNLWKSVAAGAIGLAISATSLLGGAAGLFLIPGVFASKALPLLIPGPLAPSSSLSNPLTLVVAWWFWTLLAYIVLAQPRNLAGSRRIVLLLPALVQIALAVYLLRGLRGEGISVERALGVIVLLGAVGIMISRGRPYRAGLLLFWIGLLAPVLIGALALHVDTHTRSLGVLGDSIMRGSDFFGSCALVSCHSGRCTSCYGSRTGLGLARRNQANSGAAHRPHITGRPVWGEQTVTPRSEPWLRLMAQGDLRGGQC